LLIFNIIVSPQNLKKMETQTATRRVISDKSAEAQRIIAQAKAKKQQEAPNSSPAPAPELSKKAADVKAALAALTPEERKQLMKELKPAKERTISRMDAVCMSLKESKPETVKEWIKATNAVYGTVNDQESLFNIRYAMKVLKHFSIAFPEK